MADIPPPPPSSPPPSLPQAPPPTAPSPGYMPPPITPRATTGIPIGTQLRASAWPIGIGVAGILLPIISGLILNGNVYYFFVLPVFGVIYSVRLMSRGVWIGGIVAIVLNVLAGLASLAACGALNPGGS